MIMVFFLAYFLSARWMADLGAALDPTTEAATVETFSPQIFPDALRFTSG